MVFQATPCAPTRTCSVFFVPWGGSKHEFSFRVPSYRESFMTFSLLRSGKKISPQGGKLVGDPPPEGSGTHFGPGSPGPPGSDSARRGGSAPGAKRAPDPPRGGKTAPRTRIWTWDPTYQPGNPPESVLAGMAPPLSEGGTTRFLKGKTGSGGVLDPRIRAAGAPRRGGLDRHSRPKTRAGHPKPILAGVAFRTIHRVHPGPRFGPGDPRTN